MAFVGVLPEAPGFGQTMGRALGQGLSQGIGTGADFAQKMSMEIMQYATSGTFGDALSRRFKSF